MLEKPISLEVSYFPFSLELPAAAARFDTRGFESALRHKTDAGFAISEKRRWGFSVPVEERSNQFNFFEFLFRLQLQSFLLLENLFWAKNTNDLKLLGWIVIFFLLWPAPGLFWWFRSGYSCHILFQVKIGLVTSNEKVLHDLGNINKIFLGWKTLTALGFKHTAF